MVKAEGQGSHQVGAPAAVAPEGAEDAGPEHTFLHDGGHEHRHGRHPVPAPAGHVHQPRVVGVFPALAQKQHHERAHGHIAQVHEDIIFQYLQQAVGRPVTEGVKVPPEEAKQQAQHIQQAHGVADHIGGHIVHGTPVDHLLQQQRQQPQVHRQPGQGGHRLPFGEAAGKFNAVFAHQLLAFLCSSYSRFMASMGVRLFRSVLSRVLRTWSAPTSARLIWSTAAASALGTALAPLSSSSFK